MRANVDLVERKVCLVSRIKGLLFYRETQQFVHRTLRKADAMIIEAPSGKKFFGNSFRVWTGITKNFVGT